MISWTIIKIGKKTVTETAFYLARKKFNPQAICVMSNEFIANYYDNEADSLKNGSKIILPNTKENTAAFGRISASANPTKNQSKPVGGLLSTLHDCLNNTFLDMQFGSCTLSEMALAAQHIKTYCENYVAKAIFTFDRGYPSMRLIDQLLQQKQYFLFRVSSVFLKAYMDQVQDGEDRLFEVTFDRKTTNHYREDIRFRQHLMNTTYQLWFIKIIIGKDIVEYLISNLPMNEYSIDDLKELYHLRWTIETSYNRLKNRIKLEEFSGFKEILISSIRIFMQIYGCIT